MRPSFTLLSILLCGAAAAAEPLPLKVMSFNIRYGTANDGPNAWVERKDIVAKMLDQYDPDIIGLQECLDFQAEFIKESFRDYRWYGIGRDLNGRGEMTAIAYKWRDFVPVESGTFWVSEAPEIPASRSWDAAITRTVTWIKFHHWSTNTFFYFFNTHLDHMGRLARKHGALLIAERIRSVSRDFPVILTGDFNAHAERSEPYEMLVQKGINDAWTAAESTFGGTQTFGSWYGPSPTEENRRIDWIMFRGPVKVNTCETILYNEDDRYPSDHFPVQAELVINPN